MTNEKEQTVAILGATSAVAIAFARLLSSKSSVRFLLLGRDEPRLAEILADLKARGASPASDYFAGEIGNPEEVSTLFKQCTAKASPDKVLLAYGLLGDQHDLQSNLEQLRSMVSVNFVSSVMWCEAFASAFEQNGKGQMAVIGSVAGDRGRQSNYLYGSTKAALERVCEGMSHRFASNKDINITIVKPGFIDTPMTDHLDKSGPLWASPEKVAEVILSAMKSRRVRVYAPWFWRWILLIIRALPVPVMHKTKM